MKKVIQILFILAVSILLTGMAQARTLEEKIHSLNRVRVDGLGSSLGEIVALETYYGESFSASTVVDFSQATSLSTVLESETVTVESGTSFSSQDIEFAFIHVPTGGSVKKAPHE